MANTRIADEWGNFVAIPHEFVDNAMDLSDTAFRLFVFLRRYTNSETHKAFPSYKFIQEKNGWTPKTIAKAIRELEAAGWVEREKAVGSVTQYTLKRKNHFPQGSEPLPTGKQGTSHREVVVLPVGKSKKNNSKKTKEKELASSLRSGSRNPHYDYFAGKYEEKYKYPYSSKRADFIQYASWKKTDAGRSSDADFERTVLNYLASPLGQHTFADLVTRFAVFRISALDRFGKPVETRFAPTPGSAAPLPRKSCGRCVNGYILPQGNVTRALKCSCQEVANAVTAS